MRYLLIDDCRNIHVDTVARDYNDGITQLEKYGPWDVLYLDHDLASFTEDGEERTGYHIMCWLEANPQYLPGRIECVSSNPVGRARIDIVIKKLY